MTASQSSRIGGPRFTCRRWVEKDSYAFEWHRKCSRRTSKRPEYLSDMVFGNYRTYPTNQVFRIVCATPIS